MLSFLKIFLLLVFLLVNFITCTTKDGVEVIVEPGQIYVISDGRDSAHIFLDYRDTGKLTPALLEDVVPGIHVIHLFKSTYKSTPDSISIAVEENTTDTASFHLIPTPSGNIRIESSPDSARLYLNKLNFGLTPLKIEGVPEGQYILNLVKGNFSPVYDTINVVANDNIQLFYQLEEDLRKFVILEHFSNWACFPCVPVDSIVSNLMNSYGPENLVVLSYHAYFPSDTDPMYLSAKTDNDIRIEYYDVYFTPKAYIDGILVIDDRTEEGYSDLINKQIKSDTLFATISFQSLDQNQTSMSGLLEVEALEDFPLGCKLYISLIEDDIIFSGSAGPNGQKHFEVVLRSFYPDAHGLDINLVKGDKLPINFNFTLKAEWGDDLTVIAFVQNSADKSVLQSGWTRYPPF